MRTHRSFFIFLAVLLAAPAAGAQVWGEIAGRITDAETGGGLPGASVLIEGTNFGSAADAEGRYGFRVPEGRYPVRVSIIGYTTARDTLVVAKGRTTAFSVALRPAVLGVGEAVVQGQVDRNVGVSTIDARTIQDMPIGLNDALGALKAELGVTSSNELSNAFSVRGGSYDENQFFIDGFEVYRPLRARQGEQEGLGLVNGDLTERMTLFAGGFPVRYGGKLASVVEARYARPAGALVGTGYRSRLDAGGSVEGVVGGVGLAVAARTARPQKLFEGQELKGGYDPDFKDIQGLADVRLGSRHALRALGLYARHRFRFAPSQRNTTFGIFPNLVRTVAIDFEGTEEDGYDVAFGGLLLTSTLSTKLRAEHRASVFRTEEFEGYDVTSRASLFRRQQRPDGSDLADLDRLLEGTTLQTDRADNRIQQTVGTLGGRYLMQAGRHAPEAGWQARVLRFHDALDEKTTFRGRDAVTGEPTTVVADSLFDAAPLSAFQGSAWVEDALALSPRLTATAGLRADYFSYNAELTLSPRISALYRADSLTTWTVSAGVYHQAPTYRELRGTPAPGESILSQLDGDIASQRSIQGVVGVERFFPTRRLYVRAEAYAKALSNLISYDVENVRVVYSGENDSDGYAAGLDVQLRGELVPGMESWVNYGLLFTGERFFDPGADASAEDRLRFERRGGGDWLPRPTDRRHNLTMFVQDYVPGDQTWSLHIRTLYGTGTPTTAPARDLDRSIDGVSVFEPGVRHALRFNPYFRFDLGATKRVRVGRTLSGGPLMLKATAEVLNVFDHTNEIAYTYAEQVSREGRRLYLKVPTRLTPRTLNVRVRLDF